MGQYKVIFLKAALSDLEEIVLYIARDSKENALKLYDKLMELANSLSDFPNMGALLPDKKLRKKDFRRLVLNNYMIFYKVVGAEVVVMRVLHGARDYPKLFSDLE